MIVSKMPFSGYNIRLTVPGWAEVDSGGAVRQVRNPQILTEFADFKVRVWVFLQVVSYLIYLYLQEFQALAALDILNTFVSRLLLYAMFHARDTFDKIEIEDKPQDDRPNSLGTCAELGT